MNVFRLPTVIFSSVIAVGCALAGSSADKQAVTTTVSKIDLKDQQDFVVVDSAMPPKVAYGALNNGAPNYLSGQEVKNVPFESAARAAVLKTCAAEQSREEFAPALVPIVGWVIDYLVGWASDKVQKEVENYTKSYEAQTPTYFYSIVGTPGEVKQTRLAPNIRCFRYMRRDPNSKTGEYVLDVIGQLAVSADQDYFQVRPLSVYLKTPLVKGDKVSIAMQLSAKAVWFDQTRGHDEQIFDTPLFSESFTPEERSSAAVKYFFKHFDDPQKLGPALDAYAKAKAPGDADPFLPWDSRPHLPLAPISVAATGAVKSIANDRSWTVDGEHFQAKRAVALPQIKLIADLSEVGNQPLWLRTLSSVLKKEGSSISKSLTSAADKALGVKSGGS
jgi:hypothetical protein